ncbi:MULTISPECIES: hypothetical protein [Cyanophyceae]|uniref:hypothetical protein n=1 Tax=Cyanophyceae TaxID=3028117 RepID=UPI0016897187|nr:hypothetical protein [Trichocoleus sp. FACHB-69]MBD1833299.1 hypothetical protein [Cyanobacteria bacterium FACHB-472]MBD1930307.1 hypothetical protein [Trichocoleus sp. FACHB-69]
MATSQPEENQKLQVQQEVLKHIIVGKKLRTFLPTRVVFESGLVSISKGDSL